ncbi:putative bifunctional diguanylate cyclase/phosphodiesterase [Streptomyces sp. NPDC101219]|uniref:putative bifunctional diguanylate cyclase/phosphodiesterase n=1 Tax=Streptomyces sp. NPDC101219 TaxID=3366131 RepID=UPI0038281FB3
MRTREGRPRPVCRFPARRTVCGLAVPAAPVPWGIAEGARDAVVPAVVAGLLLLLAAIGIAVAVASRRRAAAREQVLRLAAASLTAASRPEEIEQICATAAAGLVGPGAGPRTVLLPTAEARELSARLAGSPDGPDRPGDGDRPENLTARRAMLVPLSALGPELAARFSDLPAALVCLFGSPGRPSAEPTGALLAVGDERRLGRARGALELLTAQAGLAAGRVALRREIVHAESDAYFRTLVHNASDVILVVDDDEARVRYASPSARAVFGSEEPVGRRLADLVDPAQRGRVLRTLEGLRAPDREETHDHWWVVRDAGRIEVEVRCRDLRRDPAVHGMVVTLRDVTEQRQLEQELTQRAFHDSLTGLPNRTLLLERTGRALLRGRRGTATTCLLFIDLDDFKIVNDTLGHACGDRLLRAVAGRLSAVLHRTDTAARLGGDEFAVLMEDARQPLDAELLAAQVVQTLSRPFPLAEGTVEVSASVGVATAQDTTDAEELLALADLALYTAKAAGKHQWRRFLSQRRPRPPERPGLRARLGDALSSGQFTLLYQPVVEIVSGEIAGFEALARWPGLRGDAVPPGRFIPLAEETGDISALGAWVLRRAASDMARLQRSTERRTPTYLSVNVSAQQWWDTDFLSQVCGALDTAGLAPGTLQLELTESVLMRRTDRIDALIGTLKELGVRLAVDDFGTGYASLSYLRDFPVDVLKIDKSFVDDVPREPRRVALLQGILRLAHTLDLQVVAEGVEEPGQRDLLARLGCGYGQGYLFARPMTLEQAEAVLRQADGRRPR